ncbi:hypothetical protein Ciccas_010601 [Cichlidogyrus casuarinus]|uniref:Uncharacterized protein n=1 Tax=Cichlidogyrus casuarinus TaxID=1844966 RepID=A0ABD2PVQ2_9PLAT
MKYKVNHYLYRLYEQLINVEAASTCNLSKGILHDLSKAKIYQKRQQRRNASASLNQLQDASRASGGPSSPGHFKKFLRDRYLLSNPPPGSLRSTPQHQTSSCLSREPAQRIAGTEDSRFSKFLK